MKLKHLNYFLIFYSLIILPKDENKKIILISIPKTGTWMLSKCIHLLSKRKNALHRFLKDGLFKNYSKLQYDFENVKDYKVPGNDIHFFTPSPEIFDKCLKSTKENEYLIGHLIFNPIYKELLNHHNYKIIFLIRDPRDQLVSRVNYIYKKANFFSGLQHINFDDLLLSLIGSAQEKKINNILSNHIQCKYKPTNEYISNINQFYNFFLPWKNQKNCLLIKFEDLVGSKGNGRKENQIETINKIANFIGIEADEAKVNKVTKKLFGGTTTFAKGQIGSWKKNFNDNHKTAFKKVAGQLLIELGYEKDLNW